LPAIVCCPSHRTVAHGGGGKRGSHGAAGQHPYSTSCSTHGTGPCRASSSRRSGRPCTCAGHDARRIARHAAVALLQHTYYPDAPYTARRGASCLRTDLPSPIAAAASGPPGTCSIAKPPYVLLLVPRARLPELPPNVSRIDVSRVVGACRCLTATSATSSSCARSQKSCSAAACCSSCARMPTSLAGEPHGAAA
jgi:hypothetical protein